MGKSGARAVRSGLRGAPLFLKVGDGDAFKAFRSSFYVSLQRLKSACVVSMKRGNPPLFPLANEFETRAGSVFRSFAWPIGEGPAGSLKDAAKCFKRVAEPGISDTARGSPLWVRSEQCTMVQDDCC